MKQYEMIIKSFYQYILIFIPFIILLIYLLIKSVSLIKSYIKTENNWEKDKTKIRNGIILIALAMYFILVFVIEVATPFIKVNYDFYTDNYLYFEGVITKTEGSNSILGTKIYVNKSEFNLTLKDEDKFKYNIGDYCKIIYGKISNYVFEYKIVEK